MKSTRQKGKHESQAKDNVKLDCFGFKKKKKKVDVLPLSFKQDVSDHKRQNFQDKIISKGPWQKEREKKLSLSFAGKWTAVLKQKK